MTARTTLKLSCDYPLCNSVFERDIKDVEKIRHRAALAGWTVREDDLDFCGAW